MGNPKHYSIELPTRCLWLIKNLWPVIKNDRVSEKKFDGPLTTTFLISLAMPMIVLPIERVLKHIGNNSDLYADDRTLDKKFTKKLHNHIGKIRFGESEFYTDNAWAFVTTKKVFNIADGLPVEVATELCSIAARKRASEMPCAQMIMCVRNALAHGGILYLDEWGNSSHGGPVGMLAFVSAKYKGRDKSKIDELRILRVSEAELKSFLELWAAWLNSSGIERLVAA